MAEPASRPRVLISAYACGPGDESEASAGFAFACAAARDHDVWVVTRPRFAGAVEDFLRSRPDLRARMTFHYVDLDDRVLRHKRRGRDVYWYYWLWQRRVGKVAAELSRQVRFDVLHHVTFAVDWLPCGLVAVPAVPLVWGPVGGASYVPRPLIRTLGRRAGASELLREGATRACRRVWGEQAARRASLVIAQNAQVARRFAGSARVVVEPNAAFASLPIANRAEIEDRHAVFVGRLLGWKGAHLAIAALAESPALSWTLDLYGTGPERVRLQHLAYSLGVQSRVTFRGQRPRAEVLAAMTRAGALLFPSMHDAAGWAAGEASSIGRPVVCLDVGGAALLADRNAVIVPAGRTVVRDLAQALENSRTLATEPHRRWAADRLAELLGPWYADARRGHEREG